VSLSGERLRVMLAFLSALSLANSVSAQAQANDSAKPGKPSMIQTSEPAKPASYNANSLHRLDFRVVGKSCAVCLMGIQKKVKVMPGVVKAAVMLKRPYGAVIIYDSTKQSKESLINKAKAEDKEVKVEQVTDFPIQKLPTILIPLYGIPKTASADVGSDSHK